jgi:hypothetical protein
LVRERFAQAVGTVDLDVLPLVARGAQQGRRMRKQRRLLEMGGGAATVAVAATLGLLAGSGVLSGSGASSGPADRAPSSPGLGDIVLVTGNPRALAAAVLAALPEDASADLLQTSRRPARHSFVATFSVSSANGYHGTLSVTAQQPLPANVYDGCPQPGNLVFCGTIRLADGRHAFGSAFAEAGGLDVFVDVKARGVFLEEKVAGATSFDQLPLSRAELATIALDRRVGLQTTTDMIRAGERLRTAPSAVPCFGCRSPFPTHSTGK